MMIKLTYYWDKDYITNNIKWIFIVLNVQCLKK